MIRAIASHSDFQNLQAGIFEKVPISGLIYSHREYLWLSLPQTDELYKLTKDVQHKWLGAFYLQEGYRVIYARQTVPTLPEALVAPSVTLHRVHFPTTPKEFLYKEAEHVFLHSSFQQCNLG